MNDSDLMHICDKHVMPLMYRDNTCPWCTFLSDVGQKLINEYKRGFEDGVAAAEKEAKEAPTEGEKP